MKSKLLKLKLTNFKGAKSLEVEFGEKTDIFGRNGSKKTTIADAFNWLMFGKNSEDRSDFEIKTLDENNVAIPKLEHEVEGVLEVDGNIITLKRVLKEKWVKPRGAEEAQFSGHTIDYYWNDVPLDKKGYKEKVESICDEKVFKLITNPGTFNALNWKEQREILFDIAGQVSDDDVLTLLTNKSEASRIKKELDSNKKLKEFQAEVKAKKTKISDVLKAIPTRIDETTRNLPEAVDAKLINSQIEDLNFKIDEVDQQITDKSKANEAILNQKSELQDKIYDLKRKKGDLEHQDSLEKDSKIRESRKERDELNMKLRETESERDTVSDKIDYRQEKVSSINKEIDKLRESWNQLNAEEIEISENDVACPACKRELENASEKREEMIANFNRNKVEKLEGINSQGKAKKEEVAKLNKELEELQTKKVELTEMVEFYRNKIANLPEAGPVEVKPNPEIAHIDKELASLEEEIRRIAVADNSAFREQKTKLQSELQELKNKLAVNDQIERGKLRIEELEAEGKKLGQELANLERTEFSISEFTKRKIEMVETRINSMFSMVTFKMYKDLINGGEDETCQALINGVPFSDANNAARINAGIDIINTLSEHYNVHAPIIIDNAESVTDLIESNSQIIRLVVSKDHETLSVVKVVDNESLIES